MSVEGTVPRRKNQDFGQFPLERRETDNYNREYVTTLVEKWDQLIDWRARAEGEGTFFIDQLKAAGATRVLDVAAGTGFHSVRLLDAGFDVTSVDGSPQMLSRAFKNAEQHGHVLRTIHSDWRWLNRDVYGTYDAVICLGNSFTHLFTDRDRRKALAEFYAVLAHDGMLILDQRNYDAILDNGFSSKHTYYYCGASVSARPEHVDDGLARFRYEFPDDTVFHLNMYPIRRGYTRRLMREVGFQKVNTFGDFQETHRQDDPDFYIHVASKAYVEEPEETEDTAK